MNKNSTKLSRQAQLLKAIQGIAKHFPNASTLTFGGATHSPADLTSTFQRDLDAMAATAQATATLHAKVELEASAHADAKALLEQLKAYVLAVYGNTKDVSETLADFGFTPRRSPKTTVATKAEAQAKAAATRKARSPAGSVQKAEIAGSANAPATTPPAAPAPKA